MKINNKGFAITAVLYGLLILFVILVGTYLSVLSAKKDRIDNLVDDIENEYNNRCIVKAQEIEFPYAVPYAGSYTFNITDVNGNISDCDISLEKNTVINFNGGQLLISDGESYSNLLFLDQDCEELVYRSEIYNVNWVRYNCK